MLLFSASISTSLEVVRVLLFLPNTSVSFKQTLFQGRNRPDKCVLTDLRMSLPARGTDHALCLTVSDSGLTIPVLHPSTSQIAAKPKASKGLGPSIWKC